jgi:hypothetical protein
MKMHRSLRKSSFAPRVEELESRLTPALTLVPSGGTLTIAAVGFRQLNSSHTVTILDDGKGDYTVTVDGTTRLFTGLNGVTFTGGNKPDNVTYRLTGDLQQTDTLTFNLKGSNDIFSGGLMGNIGHTSGGTTTNGFMNLNINDGPGNGTTNLAVFGAVQKGSFLGVNENFNATGVANTVTSNVTIIGSIFGGATFQFLTGQSTGVANKETLNFSQPGSLDGDETVFIKGTTEAPGFIHDDMGFNGQLLSPDAQLRVSETAGSNSVFRATNILREQFTMFGSVGTLVASENNVPASKGTETLNIFPPAPRPAPTFIANGSFIEQAPGSTATTNDPGDVAIF